MSYLREAWERAPLHMKYPPHARLRDHEPWTGREDRISRLVADTREIAAVLRQLRAVVPRDNPDVEKWFMMLVHFDARIRAQLASWHAQGLAN